MISVVQSLDFSRFGNQKALIKVTLGVVAVVIDEREREAESFNELISRSPEFRSICDSHEISMSDLSTVKPRVREALDEGEVIIPQGEELTNRDPALPGPTPTEERPEVYWRERSAEYWAWTAQRWEHLPDEFKKGIPKKYRDRVGQLRHWAPWKDEESEATSDDENRSTEERIDLLKEDVQSLKGDLEELKEIEKEAEKLVREMESETIEDN
ncbi:hypothetical protein DVR14_01190 (plasmid) [Natrinema thermotolerans]|nr:hypothetical protein DVR14_01190 [Natrinema thermotolerans]